MESIFLFSKQRIADAIKHIAPASYRVDQIWDGIYSQFYQDWSDFSNLPKKLVTFLSENYFISTLNQINATSSGDGNTQKYLFRLFDGALIEAVHIRNENRNTICISTQAGCAVGCVFCATGGAGFERNLSIGEIVSQVSHFGRNFSEINETISNIVLMGMGEPFLNYENTIQAVLLFNNADAFDIGARRITVSTIGIPEKIIEFSSIGKQFNLAISLHAPNDYLREQLVPIARKIKIADIISAAAYYIEKTNRRVTYEYVMIKDINDKLEHAKELAKLLSPQNCHVNLIALNKNAHFNGNPPSLSEIKNFSQILLENKIPTTIRNSQGAGIQAGCGQLSGKYHLRGKR